MTSRSSIILDDWHTWFVGVVKVEVRGCTEDSARSDAQKRIGAMPYVGCLPNSRF